MNLHIFTVTIESVCGLSIWTVKSQSKKCLSPICLSLPFVSYFWSSYDGPRTKIFTMREKIESGLVLEAPFMGSWNNTFQTLIWACQFYLKALVVQSFVWSSTSKLHSLRPRHQIMQTAHWIPMASDFHANRARFNGFLHNVSNSFQNLRKVLQTFSLTRSSQRHFLFPKLVIETINLLVFGPRVVQFRE